MRSLIQKFGQRGRHGVATTRAELAFERLREIFQVRICHRSTSDDLVAGDCEYQTIRARRNSVERGAASHPRSKRCGRSASVTCAPFACLMSSAAERFRKRLEDDGVLQASFRRWFARTGERALPVAVAGAVAVAAIIRVAVVGLTVAGGRADWRDEHTIGTA